MTRAEQRAVQRNLRGLRRRSVGPAVLYRPHDLSNGAGVPVNQLLTRAPASAGDVALRLGPVDGRLRGCVPAGLLIKIPGESLVEIRRTAAEAPVEDGGLIVSLTKPLSAAVAVGETIILFPAAEHVFPHAVPLRIHHDRLPETLIGQVEVEYALPALPGLPRPRPGDRLRVADVEAVVLAVPSAMAGLYVVQTGGAS